MKVSNKKTKGIRLQVFLSRSGVCSRRAAMDVVKSGVVSVNGKKIEEPSYTVDPLKDKVSVRGVDVRFKAYEYLLLNKPSGYITTKAHGLKEKNVMSLLPASKAYLSPVGRLDKDTEGVLLFTNDGDLAYRLTHPSRKTEKCYEVLITAKADKTRLKKLEKGILLEGKKTAPVKISNVRELTMGTSFLLTMIEGRKRQVRLMCQSIGYHVSQLKRIRQGSLNVKGLKTGEFRMLTLKEISELKSEYKPKMRPRS